MDIDEKCTKHEGKTKTLKTRRNKNRRKTEEQKGKEGAKGEKTTATDRKLFFYRRTVKRNRNEIEAQKNQIFSPDKKKKKKKAAMALQSYSSSHTPRPWADETASSQRNGQSEPCFPPVRH